MESGKRRKRRGKGVKKVKNKQKKKMRSAKDKNEKKRERAVELLSTTPPQRFLRTYCSLAFALQYEEHEAEEKKARVKIEIKHNNGASKDKDERTFGHSEVMVDEFAISWREVHEISRD